MVDGTDKIFPTRPDTSTEEKNTSWAGAIPVKQGLYDPQFEKDACGVGFAWYDPSHRHVFLHPLIHSHIKGKVSHKIVTDGIPS
jgi:glutamate synthase (NADH)